MRTSRSTLTLLAAFAALGGFLSFANAQSVATQPVGAMSVSVPANSDVLVSAPLQRSAVYNGRVGSVSGSQLTVAGSPGWTSNQFVYVQGSQPETYFVQVLSGSLRGAFYTVTANSTGTLTLDLNGDSIASLTSDDSILISPYWTLGTLFPAGAGFPGSSTFTATAEVQLANVTSTGTNLPSVDQFFYYTGTASGGAGWRRIGTSPLTKFDNTVIYPDVPFRIRNRSTAISLSHLGSVSVAGHRTAIGTLAANRAQDNFVTLMSSADVSLASSGLISSGAFVGSASFTPVDSLLVINNSATGFNKPPSATYFYYTGTLQGGAGWRKVGSAPTLKFDNELLKSQDGFIIRKASNPTPQLVSWSYVPSYAN